ncbi:MAG: hypothetical protein IKD91_01340 [Clostridiales bacterium]|nr:hypothetical protein [Clostridiales bacterium]
MGKISNIKPYAKKALDIFLTLLFFISFFPYIHAVYSAYTGVFFGFQGSAWFFGFGGIFITLVFRYVLLIPVCLIYQVKYGIEYFPKYKGIKTAALTLIAVIVLSGVTATVFGEKIVDINLQLAQTKIEEYFADKYGEEAVRDMTYSVDSRYEMTFKGTSPSLPEGQSYEIRVYSGRSEKYNIVDFLVDENNETNRVNYK